MITDSSFEEAALRRTMLQCAKKAVYLADRSKAGGRYAYNICAMREVAQAVLED